MLRSPKSSVGWVARKAVALIMAYSFFATCIAADTLAAQQPFSRTTSGGFLSLRAATDLLRNKLASSVSNLTHSSSTNSQLLAAPSAATNVLSNAPLAMVQGGGGATANVSFFGPQEFVRTTGDPNTYTVTVQVPSWVGNPYNLHIQSGEADGSNRVSSATILVNNVQVAGQSDFNEQVFTLDRTVTLTPTTTLVVTLASKPGSYLRINLAGAGEDRTAPVLTIIDPAPDSAINSPQAHLDIHYQDLAGPGEPAASGVNTSTLQVLLDGVDRSSLFTKRSDEATADVPASLALAAGPHTLTASIQDNAGNTAHATSNFQVDLTPPSLQILQPTAGTYLNTTTPQIQLAYSDNVAVNTASLHVTVNGIDVSAQFSKSATGATATLSTALPQGANDIVATISDTAGNHTTASVPFNVDTTPPVITILHPAAGSRHGSSTVEYSIQFSDDQAIDLSSLQVKIDGTLQSASTTLSTAAGSTTLTDGDHTITASIKDKAGNQANASSPFTVDTQLPTIHIAQPAPGAVLNNPAPPIQVQYSDPDIDPSTLKITVDGVTVSNVSGVTTTGANATLSSSLADGPHTISAQIADLTGNVGQTSNPILIDTIKPQITIVAPVGPVNTASPSASAHYSDSGSGIDPTSVHVFSDSTDVTASFSVGNADTAGVLSGLTEGTHQFRVTVADKAGNVADTSSSFLVDVTPPQVTFTSPANNSFINNPQPSVVLNYSDSGSGIDLNSIHVFIQPLNGVETEIPLTIGANQATGTISTPLAAGTYHLRAQVADKAGNVASPDVAFALDVTAPTYIIQTPAANAFLKTATPTFTVTYQDDSSGVDPAQFALRVDGIDRTNRMTATDTGASGTLQASDALADGTHQVDVTVVDRAGNKAPVVPQSFLVDTTPPTIVITTPVTAAYSNNNHLPIAISYSDSGSGIDVTTFRVTIDGADQTPAFTASLTNASGSPAAALPDGIHTVIATISDLAGNPSTATASFTIDTVPPQVTITQPASGLFTNAASLVVTGTVVDASPVTVTVEGTNVPVQNGAFTSAGITLGTTATQVIHVVATDAAGNSTPINLTINIDRNPPTITPSIAPAPNAAGWNNTAVTVSFLCADAESGIATCPDPVQLPNEGANQTVTRTTTDRAGNTATATVTVNIDKTPPVIVGTPAPAPNAAGWNTTDETVTWACSDNLSGVPVCPPPQVVSTEGKAQQISATVTDKAGNSATATVLLNIEKTAPTIMGSASPAPNAAGWNNTNVTVNFVCTPSASDIVTCQSPVSVTAEGRGQSISGSVTDQAGKTGTTSVTVNLDKTPPLISASAAPPANGAGWNNTDVVISYLCSDSLSGIALCPPPATVSTEGSAEKISAQAVDIAGNSSAVTTTLNIDKTPPTITASAAPSPNGAGWNNTNVTVSYSCTDNLSGVASCPSSTLVASEGQNQNISGQATDVAGNTATGSIALSIDKTPPTIVQLSTPDHISRLHGAQVSVTVNDNFMVTQVVINVNGTTLGTFTSAPYQADLAVPAGANPGDTLTVTATATDEAGNTQTSSRGVRVAADGVIVGQVLSDATSFPIQGAVVQSLGTTSVNDQTDDHGRYSLQASDSHLFLTVTSPSPATTTVEREVFVQEGVGTVPVDARLTPLATPMAIGSAGGTLTAGNISVNIPSGVVGDGTSFQLTSLTGQGLPGLLPMGWSPLAAFDLRATSSAMNLPVAIAQMPNTVTHLVSYNPALHAWTMVAQNLQSISGTVSTTVPTPGAYALVVTDATTPPITVPDPGEALAGIPMQLLDSSASSSGSLSPAILPPSGGTSTATLGVQTSAQVPSGTVIQANISEKFSLKSGDVVSEENRSEDIVLYNALAPTNSTLGAQFAVTPSRKYTNTQLLTGKVHLDILAGREGVRGQPGGSNPLTLSDGVSTLSVPSGALNEDTAISLQSISFEDFVPTTGSQSPVQEVLVDFSGDTLNVAAQLSISATGLNPADTYLLTKAERIDGVPYMALIGLAQINGGNLTSVASPGLPGVTQGGEYVFYDISAPTGFVQGVVSSSAGPVQALVQTDSLQIVSITGADGRYIVPALAGSANVKASAPHTNLIGSASVQVTAGQTTQANIPLAGAVTSAVVSPADGALGVPSGTTITITTTAPLNPQSIQQSNLVLLKGTAQSGTPVALQPFVLSTSGTVLSFAPQSNLDPATQYTIQVSGLADTFGGAIVVPTSSFTTKAVAPLNFDPNAITFSFPDQNGNIHVSAPANSLPPGTAVMIVDQSSGLVLSLTALNDGSVSGDFPGTINDVLQVTVTDPNGANVTFTRSQFIAPDGTTAVGSGGGTVTGPGGVELRIPQGALDKAATFKIEAFGSDRFPERPDLPGSTFGGGLKFTSSDQPTFKKEVKLAFPKPTDAPDGAFFQVYRRMQGPNGQVAFEDLDYALVEGTGSTAKVVTASFPYRGLIDFNMLISNAAYQGQVLGGPLGGNAVAGALENNAIMVWTFENSLPGISLGGSITGRVRYAIPPGAAEPDGTINKTGDTVFIGVPNITVTVDVNTSTHALGNDVTVATTQPDGTFTFSDPAYRGGTINLVASDGAGHSATATATEVVSLTDKTVNDFAGPLLKFYRNVAFADMVVPSPVPPPPPPKIGVRLFTLNDGGFRVPANGLIADGTPLVIAFQTDGSISQPPNVTINGLPFPSQPDAPDNPQDPNKLDFDLVNKFVPNGAGVYNVVVTGLTAFAQPVTVTRSFMVVGAGGSNNTIKVGDAPTIVSTTPVSGATGVPINSFIQVLFSEPVTHIPGHVTLVPDDGSTPPPITLSGINYLDGTVINSLGNSDAVSSLTIQPTEGLKYSVHYTLHFTQDIVDLDNTVDNTKKALALVRPEDKNPPEPPIGFTTFGPEILGGTSAFSSTRPIVMGDRVYVAGAINSSLSQVSTYDISDPSNPSQITSSTTFFLGRAQDAAGEENAPIISGGNLLAVGAGLGATAFGLPANLWLYNVSNDQIVRVGAVSVTSSVVNEGQILRLAMKGNFAYSGTFPVGIQVVDLQQAISEYQDVFTNDPVQFGQQVTTDGEGFARDAVVNTIPVKDPDGRNFMVFGIQTGDFATSTDPQNAANQTLVVAAGAVPGPPSPTPISFVVADPTAAGSSALLYSGSLQSGSSNLTFGLALALGQLTDAQPDANGNPVQRSVAVVVGTGTAPDPVSGQLVTGGVLAVVDMTVPSQPSVISIIKLDAFPTDVVLKDSLALVGTGANEVLLISLADPKNPVNAGTISGGVFGDKLAVTPDGFLVSSSMNGNLGGIHTATFKPFLGIANDPILARSTDPTIAGIVELPLVASLKPMVPANAMVQAAAPSAPYEAVADTTVTTRVFSAVPTSNGTFLLDRKVCGLESVQVTLDFGTAGKVTNAAKFTIPKGTQFCGTTVTFAANVNTDQGKLNNTKAVPAGVVNLVVDSNNDTAVDIKDEDKKVHSQQAFQFWEQDPLYTVQANQADLAAGNYVKPSKGLADYATVRLKVAGIFPKGSLSLKLDDGTTGLPNAYWSIVEKSGTGNLYLTDQNTAINQMNSIIATPQCDPTNEHLTGECRSVGNVVPLPSIRAFDIRDFLFACQSCPTKTTPRKLLVQYTPPQGGDPITLDSVNMDIRPLKELVVVRSARRQPQDGGQPRPLFNAVDGWASSPDSKARQVTVFVHGFDNSEDAVLTDNIPTYFKRLYWVKHPVLPAQKAGFVGVSWPSDPGKTQFPLGEVLGLETGAPFACLLRELAGGNQPEINIVAHSLGNMVVNSALQRIGPGIVTNYVMNEAAVPAEAFHDPNAPFQAGETNPTYVSKVQGSDNYGWPDDKAWLGPSAPDNNWLLHPGNWLDMVAGNPTDIFGNPDYTDFNRWNNTVSTLPEPKPYYYERWTQQRPASGVPDSASQDIHNHRGPWKGYFFSNIQKVSNNFVNTWSGVDGVLGRADGTNLGWWDLMQRFQKPYINSAISILHASSDADVNHERKTQFWATLGVTPADEEAVWSGGCDLAQPNHYNTIRQWEELGYWFASLSIAAGNGPIGSLTNASFTNLSTVQNPISLSGNGVTHSYLTAKPFYEVKPGFDQIRTFLQIPQ